MIFIDNKLPAYGKSFLNENSVNTGTSKTSIDQSAVGNTEETSVTLDLANDSGPDRDPSKKKKKEEKHNEDDADKKLVIILSDDEVRSRNLKLLNSL